MLQMNLVSDFDQLVSPDCKEINYSGRIDYSDPLAPCLIYAGSYIHFRFYGTKVKLILRNHHLCYNNYIGFVLDNNIQDKIQLELNDNISVYTIYESQQPAEHNLIIFKRQDSAHYFDFLGLMLDKDAMLLSAPIKPKRRIECFGDSVTAGEVSEAVQYVGKPDPLHNGEYSNSWYSYASITARRLGAELHNNSQGGIALFDNTGYFHGPDYVGLLSTFDKLRYNSQLGPINNWDFSQYTPHVVLVAIGQNDSHPEDYMNSDSTKSETWRSAYRDLILRLRAYYPKALIICKTTILGHSPTWDEAIEMVTASLNDPKIVHFLYSNNGCGTPGHIRIPEAELMADELTAFIQGFSDDIWLQ